MYIKNINAKSANCNEKRRFVDCVGPNFSNAFLQDEGRLERDSDQLFIPLQILPCHPFQSLVATPHSLSIPTLSPTHTSTVVLLCCSVRIVTTFTVTQPGFTSPMSSFPIHFLRHLYHHSAVVLHCSSFFRLPSPLLPSRASASFTFCSTFLESNFPLSHRLPNQNL